MKYLGFKIRYDDGTLWWQGQKRQDGSWDSAPPDGVLSVVVYHEKDGKIVRFTHDGHEWYFWDSTGLIGSNSDSIEENKKRYPDCIFKRGRWIDTVEMHRIQAEAADDRDI